MAFASGYEAYKTTKVKTSSPAHLLLMLYDGGIKWCQKAINHLEKEEKEAAHAALLKSQDIISELMIALDFSANEELAQGLYALYDYMYDRLVEANIKKDKQGAVEVLEMLKEMREMWDEVVKQTRHQDVGSTAGLNLVK
ncbi:MAG: flagellar export chaperone FliS [Firmicutes bacterium]|nr:flagellar export chaperone FliS [Bacillota bacterium]